VYDFVRNIVRGKERLGRCYRDAAEDLALRNAGGAGLLPFTASNHASLHRAHSSPSSRTMVLAEPRILVIFDPHNVNAPVPE